MAMVSWDRDMRPKVSMTPSNTAAGSTWPMAKGSFRIRYSRSAPTPSWAPDQAVNLFEEINNDEQGDKGRQAQAHEFEELPGHVVFQDMGTEHHREGHAVYISEILAVFMRFPQPKGWGKRGKGKRQNKPDGFITRYVAYIPYASP